MDPASRLQVRWYGRNVGVLLDAEYATVRIPLLWETEAGDSPQHGSVNPMHLRGIWVPDDNPSVEFAAELAKHGQLEVYVEPYSPLMTVHFALDPDGTGHLFCR